MFSTGLANPDKSIMGTMNENVPRIACCWVFASDEMKSPMPRRATRYTAMLAYKSATEPVRGIRKNNTATVTMSVPSAMPTRKPAAVLPRMISPGLSGVTSN